MDTIVIAVIAVAAFAIVLIPLLRRGSTSAADAREFAGADDIAADIAAPAAAVASADAAAPPTSTGAALNSADVIEREVLRYRAALRAGTLCPRCGQANPAESAFCSDCGKRLPLADAKEFE